jgi:hypothetical protein
MIRQDYITKMIERLAKVLANILFNRETKNYEEAILEMLRKRNRQVFTKYDNPMTFHF